MSYPSIKQLFKLLIWSFHLRRSEQIRSPDTLTVSISGKLEHFFFAEQMKKMLSKLFAQQCKSDAFDCCLNWANGKNAKQSGTEQIKEMLCK